jgi:hypothetical protein
MWGVMKGMLPTISADHPTRRAWVHVAAFLGISDLLPKEDNHSAVDEDNNSVNQVSA